MNTAMRQLFIGRFDHSLESEEQVLGRELTAHEVKGVEVSVANRMVGEGLITDTKQVIA